MNIAISNSMAVMPSGNIGGDGSNVVAFSPAPVVSSVVASPPVRPSGPQLQHIVDNINKTLKQSQQSLEFSVDTVTKTPVVRLRDTETGQVIRQFPSESALAVAQSIDQSEKRQGLIFNSRA